MELLRVDAGSTVMSCTVAFALSRVLDALTLGESMALSLGLPLAPVRSMLIFILTLATGTAVAQMGLIAFVGSAAPHLVRSLVKTKHNWVVLLSALMGGHIAVVRRLDGVSPAGATRVASGGAHGCIGRQLFGLALVQQPNYVECTMRIPKIV